MIMSLTAKINQKSKKLKEIYEISRFLKRNYFLVFADIIQSKILFKSTPSDYKLFKFYELSLKQRKTFFTAGLNKVIITKMNDPKYLDYFTDKVKFNNIFKKYLGRDWLFNKEMTPDDFMAFIKDKKSLIYKPSDMSAGEGVEKIDLTNKDTATLYALLYNKGTGLIEDFIIQHPLLATLSDRAVNTLRIITITDREKCHIVYTALRMGYGGITDNLYGGGIVAAVSQEGVVCTNAYNMKGDEFSHHPITGTIIKGFKLPFWEETTQLMKQVYNIVPQIKYVGWDVAITPIGPVLVEGNSRYPSHEPLELPLASAKKGNKHLFNKYLDPNYKVCESASKSD